jgi:hypothetical protein
LSCAFFVAESVVLISIVMVPSNLDHPSNVSRQGFFPDLFYHRQPLCG